MPANASNKGRLHTDVFLCAACLFLRKIFPWGKAPIVRGPFGFQNSLRQTGGRDAQGGGSTWTGMDERPSGKSTPQHKARCRKKALPLNGNFCAQPLQIFLTGTKGICGKLPCFASKIAVSGVLCGFGRAALEEGCAKKFSKSDGLPGVLRVLGVKAACQNRWLLASTHLVQGAAFYTLRRAKKGSPAHLVCTEPPRLVKSILPALPVEIKSLSYGQKRSSPVDEAEGFHPS